MDDNKRLKIAYYSINNPLDKRSWSGITYYLGQTLQKNVGDVDFLGPVKIPWLLDKTFRAFQKISRLTFKTEWIPKYSLLKNMYASIVLRWKMGRKHYDIVIAPAAASELAYLSTTIPIIYFGDATFKIYSETYKKEFFNSSTFTKWEGNYLETKALKKSDLIILTSKWAANSAINDYKISSNKVKIILLGANVDMVPGKEMVFEKEKNQTLTLLFLAVDWDRKGGELAYDTLQCLLNQGHDAKLIICGCTPPSEYLSPEVEVIPFINKNNKADYELFVKLLSSVHFLILPTRADCSLLVAMEANSYGVPAITTNVGGVPDVVINGINGYCLQIEDKGEKYATLIEEIYTDKIRYHKLIQSSRDRFDAELNWDKWSERFKEELKKRQTIK